MGIEAGAGGAVKRLMLGQRPVLKKNKLTRPNIGRRACEQELEAGKENKLKAKFN